MIILTNINIIDAHSHIGIDNAWEIEGNLDEYIKNAKSLNIKESLLMPTPMPIIKLANYEITPITLATYEDEHFIVQRIMQNNKEDVLLVNPNPYKYVNELLYRKIKNNNDNIKLHFVPLIHPFFDSLDYLDEIIEKYNPKALKIHGYSSIIYPTDISSDYLKLIEEKNIPLIIHTDCDQRDNNSIDYKYRNANSPINWLNLLKEYEIKAYLTHGARLSKESAEIINNNPNYMIGLGPDKLLNACKDRMYITDDYLDTLFNLFDINKICFDIDYPWNVTSYDNQELDWNSIKEIDKHLSEDEKQKVLSKNAKEFFNL